MSWAAVSCWIENHQSLAYWVQAIGSIASIWGAFKIGSSQQKAQLLESANAARNKSESLFAVVESAASFVSVLGAFVQTKPSSYVFKENWKLTNRQWLEVSIFSLSHLPAYELGSSALVRGYFGVFGGINDISRLINGALSSDAFNEQEFDYMYCEVLKQVRIVESNWYCFQQARSK